MRVNGKLLLFGVCFIMAIPLFSQNVFLELSLNNRGMQSMVRPARPGLELELLRVIERAGKDNRISGIILNISSYDAEQETAWELRNALEKFKTSGKKVCAFLSAANLDLYCLATVADRIVMDEQGTLMLTGYTWSRGYVRNTLEKLGIGVRELRYLEYKSAAETYTRDSMSDADRLQYGEILDDIMNLTCVTITTARSWTADQFDSVLNDFMFSARSALARGLVDRTGRKDAVLEAVNEISAGTSGAAGTDVKTFVVYGDSDSSITGSKNSYGPNKAGGLLSRPPVIAIVHANGVTDLERGISARNTAGIIRELTENRRVKAMVIRINSPGGSAEAADYIAEAINNAKKRKPVVVSMGAVAASGGYWASMSASHIMASPVTITGSIGVIGSWFYDKGLGNKLGLTVDSMQRGDHADLLTGIILPHRDLNQEEEARYREYILNTYGDFTTKIAAYRNMDIEQVESAARGRVFSGIGAFNAGLIDSIGGLDDAIQMARNLAGIPKDKKVVYGEFPKPRFIDKLMDHVLSTRVLSAHLLSARARIPGANAGATIFTDLFLPVSLLEDIRFRVTQNGRPMPILPFDSGLLK